MSNCFQGHAYIASFYIGLNVMAKRWPVVFPSYKFKCFLDIKVACQRIIVMPANKLYSDNFWDVREALLVQNSINVIPALLTKLLISFEFLGLLLFGLQFV